MANNDWLTQTQELMQTWTKAQQALWENWRSLMPTMSAQPASEEWKQAVSAWKDVMQRSLNAQADFVKFWSESMTAMPLMGKQMEDMSTLIVETTQRWTNVQNEIWSNWLDAVAKAMPLPWLRTGTRERARHSMHGARRSTAQSKRSAK
jgi:hypothetical protein